MSETVLVTGGLGYLGGRILGHLEASGAYTLRASTRRPPQDRPAWAGGMQVVRADLLDDGALAAICDGVDAVLHLAAMNARDCAADPERAHTVNVLGTGKLLAAAEKAGVRRFVYVSTAHVYGAPLRGEISEETVPGPVHPYAITHRAAEELVLASGIAGLVLRLSNAMGAPADPAADCWMLLSNELCRQAVTEGELVLRGTGRERRDFIPLSDVARAVDHFLGLPTEAWGDGVFNVGSGRSRSSYEMAGLIAERCVNVLGFAPPIRRATPPGQDAGGDLHYRNDKLLATGFRLGGDEGAEIEATLGLCRAAFATKETTG